VAQGLIESSARQTEAPEERQSYSVTPATVIATCDSSKEMRVQVRIPAFPSIQPWVRVSVPMAGPQRGMFFMPQVDDEVLLAFNQGDVRESYVIGSVWNGVDKPPASDTNDAVDKRIIRTPKGLEIFFDDSVPSLTLTINVPKNTKAGSKSAATVNAAQSQGGENQKNDTVPSITIDKKKIIIRRASGANHDNDQQIITLDDNGITLEAKKGDIVLKTEKGKVQIEAKSIEIKSSQQTEITASGGNCVIKGQQVQIN
jgi:uncharacterized protein involved in type VI secretion and phage assembly